MKLDRSQQPTTILTDKVHLPETNVTELANGIKLMAQKAGTQEVVRLSIVFNAGTRYQTTPFAASSMLNMLSEGSVKKSSAEVANALDFYGIYYDTNIDRDYSMVTVSCLNKFLPETLELLEQILLYPTFDAHELKIYASKRKQNIRMEREKPSYVAREEFSKAIYGASHPYGLTANENLYDTLTREDLVEHYQKHYTAANCFAVTSGMVTDAEQELIESFLLKIPRGSKILPPQLPAYESISRVDIERSGSLQSCIRVGKVLFHKGHPDFNAVQILSVVLGGYFGSRLVSNLREDKGYTYGVHSAMVTLQESGYFAIATDVSAKFKDDAIEQINLEVNRLREELIPEEELTMVKNTIIGEIIRLVDGPFGIADITIESEQCGSDNEIFNQFLVEVKEITSHRLMEVALKYLDPRTFTTVTVG